MSILKSPNPKKGRKKKANTEINEVEDNDVRDEREASCMRFIW